MKPTRTRFAPSPTGLLHVGGVRTALFAWLVARQNKGQFILRIEDTDAVREVTGSVQHIIDSLKWVGLDWDEGPDIDGSHGPYKQSQRLDIYKEWAEKLLDKGLAYADPYSKEELEALREQAKAEKRPFLFRDHRPTTETAWDGSQPLRLKSTPKDYQWQDMVMGELSAGPEAIDDFILMKSDGYPTYNFAHIIDDHLMNITHVIRSQEFIASVPRYLNLYEALGFEPPIMATLPFVMGESGKKKLSKRDGAKDILDYAKEGYLPAAMMNFLATLGWNDGSEQEIFSVDELIKKFDISRVGKSGARFDEQRLIWINGSHIRMMDVDNLYQACKDFWPTQSQQASPDFKKKVLALIQDRLKYFSEIPELTDFFFVDLPIAPELIKNHKQLQKITNNQLVEWLELVKNHLSKTSFDLAGLQEALNNLLELTGQKPAVLFSLIRIATTQAPASPGLADTLELLGKDIATQRIDNQIQYLKS